MELIYPMFALAMFTIIMVGVLGAARFIIVSSQQVHPRYLKTFDNEEHPPEYVVALARNYSNLLEMPILFYLAGLLSMTLNIVNETIILCAWAYVISRLFHTFVHVVYNNPLHRLMVFTISTVILLVMWVVIIQHVMLQSRIFNF